MQGGRLSGRLWYFQLYTNNTGVLILLLLLPLFAHSIQPYTMASYRLQQHSGSVDESAGKLPLIGDRASLVSPTLYQEPSPPQWAAAIRGR